MIAGSTNLLELTCILVLLTWAITGLILTLKEEMLKVKTLKSGCRLLKTLGKSLTINLSVTGTLRKSSRMTALEMKTLECLGVVWASLLICFSMSAERRSLSRSYSPLNSNLKNKLRL